MPAKPLEIPVRHYQLGRVYGPGMPASGREGLHDQVLRQPAGSVGLVLVHCWNVGQPDGPYPIPPDSIPRGEAGDWVLRAGTILQERIAPVLRAARAADLPVFHLAQEAYAERYASFRQIKDDPEAQPPKTVGGTPGCVEPRPYEEEIADVYGRDFPGTLWATHGDRFDIAEAVKPLASEGVVLDGWQLNCLCRRAGVTTLLYAGFMADLCILHIPGALREMTRRFRYRCVILRDCTTAYEYADTSDGQWMTRAAVRHVESELGYSASSDDVMTALRAVARPADDASAANHSSEED